MTEMPVNSTLCNHQLITSIAIFNMAYAEDQIDTNTTEKS